ncbi:hypothetical protein C5167_049908 [Papaver somniferum]|uniref:Uncharacterized protein n=1 Tax=Papaver somniferum TaxID=3469 RepID=A0A4Y7KM52_PAPSO|nr:hypothetical protein C5167_049908 [Papaver somniferum]
MALTRIRIRASDSRERCAGLVDGRVDISQSPRGVSIMVGFLLFDGYAIYSTLHFSSAVSFVVRRKDFKSIVFACLIVCIQVVSWLGENLLEMVSRPVLAVLRGFKGYIFKGGSK